MKKIHVITLLTILVLAACANPAPNATAIPTNTPFPTRTPTPTRSPTPTLTPTPSPAELLAKSADAMLAMKSARFKITREGAPVVLDTATNMSFTEINGEYQAPDRVSAQINVTIFGNVLQLQVLWLPEGNFITNPLTGKMEPAPANLAFNGAALFLAGGIPAVLRTGIQNPKLVGMENIEGVNTIHIRGEADGAVLAPLLAGAFESGTPYPVDIWMEKSTYNLVRIHIAEPDGNGWLIDVFDINAAIEINAP
ncbi:MAG: LppX_LprAFG lipoprotein [Anaerolineales bacterium]|jgi:hypothetical protein